MFEELLEGVRDQRRALPADRALRISVVIPALNEAANLPFVLQIGDYVDRVLLVDGPGSNRQHRGDCDSCIPDPHRRTGRRGQRLRAPKRLRCGKGDIIVMLDADCSMDPAEMPLFLGALLGGADFVKGLGSSRVRDRSTMTFERMLGNWGFAKLVRLLFGCRYSDITYGYIAFWSDVLPRLRLDAGRLRDRRADEGLRALRSGLRVVQL